MPWKLTAAGEEFTTDDLTLAECIVLEGELDISWVYINPLSSAKHWKAIVSTYLRRSRTAEEVAKILDAMTLKECVAGIERVEDDRPTDYEDGLPKSGDAPTTT